MEYKYARSWKIYTRAYVIDRPLRWRYVPAVDIEARKSLKSLPPWSVCGHQDCGFPKVAKVEMELYILCSSSYAHCLSECCWMSLTFMVLIIVRYQCPIKWYGLCKKWKELTGPLTPRETATTRRLSFLSMLQAISFFSARRRFASFIARRAVT